MTKKKTGKAVRKTGTSRTPANKKAKKKQSKKPVKKTPAKKAVKVQPAKKKAKPPRTTKKVKKRATLSRTAKKASKKKVPSRTSLHRALKEDIRSVLVTGAAGCVGAFLVQHLLRAGYSVTATDREGSEIPFGSMKKDLVYLPGDLTDPGFLESCLRDVDAIFHAACLSDLSTYPLGKNPLTEKAIRILYQEARAQGVKRFLHFGSSALYRRLPGPLTEESPLEAKNDLEQNHLQAERVLLGEAAPGLPVVTVLRVATIYGPGNKAQIASLAALPPLVKTLGPYYIRLSGGPRINLLHGEDAARAAVHLLLSPEAIGETFNVADNDPMTFGDFVNLTMEAYGLKPLGPGVPYPPSTLIQSILPYVAKQEIFNPLSKLSNLLWTRMVRKYKLKNELSPRIEPEALSFGSRDLILSNEKLLGLGFKLKYPRFPRGWEKTLEWYVSNEWIPRPEKI